MKKIQKSLLIFLFLLIIIGTYYISKSFNSVNSVATPQQEIKSNDYIDFEIEKTDLKKIDPKNEFKDKDKVSLLVLDKTYITSIEKDNTVYDVMQKLRNIKENNFSFNYKEYPSLGIFIDEVNGIKGGDGKYWIYSVNGKEASIGVSKYILKDGDIINWELK